MLKAYKDTTFFLITQARTYFFYKKVSFCAKNAKLSTSNFRLSTIFCTFVPYFGIIWALYKKIRYSLFIVHYSFHCCLHVLHAATTIPRVRTATTVLPLPIPPIRILRFRLSTTYPYTFALSRNAVVQPRTDVSEPYWINLYYPALDATIYCSYKPVNGNLRELTNDALEFVYRNASFATAIPEQDYAHPEASVYGVLFDLEGNTASSCQFFVTDSTRHFFRASVYCNCPPNADSLAPVYNYLRTDIIKMVETFEWTRN